VRRLRGSTDVATVPGPGGALAGWTVRAAAITVAEDVTDITDITASDARRLAAALVDLADELEPGGRVTEKTRRDQP
jgi:hypothetical protein